MARHQVALLWFLQALFLCRVLMQIYVGLYAPPFLPPWNEWYSGLLPYPILLPLQITLLMLMTCISYDNSRKTGIFYIGSDRVKIWMVRASLVYAGTMVLRYIVVMGINPAMRWLHGTIPISFHLVLAAYIYLLTRDSAMVVTTSRQDNK